MNREGSLFPRCRCGGSVKDGHCLRDATHGRKDFRWCFKIDVGADGGTRRTASGTYPTRTAALAALNSLRRDQAGGHLVQRSRGTTAEYVVPWLERICVDIAETTLRQYERYWLRLDPHLGHIKIQALTREDVLNAYAHLQKSGLSHSTIHSMHIMFHHALSDAVEASRIPSNPAHGAHKARLNPKTDVLTQTDLPVFYRACETDRYGLYYVCCLETGVRRGEGLAIRWRDLDFGAVRLSVHRQLIEVQHRTSAGLSTSLVFKETKTGRGLRTIAIGEEFARLLKAYQGQQQELRAALGLTWSPDDLVFAHFDGRPLSPSSMTTAFHNFAIRAGLPKISLHGLRRTFGAHATAGGMPATVLCRALGHSRPGFTLGTYAPFLPGVDEEAVRRVARLMRGHPMKGE